MQVVKIAQPECDVWLVDDLGGPVWLIIGRAVLVVDQGDADANDQLIASAIAILREEPRSQL